LEGIGVLFVAPINGTTPASERHKIRNASVEEEKPLPGGITGGASG
jgi:hypothetical protein